MLSLTALAGATDGELINHEPCRIEGFSIDSRKLNKGDFFIPLAGSRTDGHEFLRDAFDSGASGAFIRSRDYLEADFSNLILVEDTEKALIQAAEYYRLNFDIPIVGVTGSWGKTTTKELIASILDRAGEVHKAPGNYNTEYGLPLALLEMPDVVDFGVFELGLQYPDDIGKLSQILSPTIGLITGVGKVHLENFSSVEDIAREKLKLARGMETGASIVINADSEPLRITANKKNNYRFLQYGDGNPGVDYFSREVEVRGIDGLELSLYRSESREPQSSCSSELPVTLRSGLNSRANVNNIIGASAVALEMGLSVEDVVAGVDIDPLPQRLNPISFSGGIVLDDTYNANPTATVNALKHVSEVDSFDHRYFVFGDMKELGEDGPKLHRELSPAICRSGIETMVGVGDLTRELVEELRMNTGEDCIVNAEWFDSRSELKGRLVELISGDNNLVLVKGSRSMEMEEFVDFLTGGSYPSTV